MIDKNIFIDRMAPGRPGVSGLLYAGVAENGNQTVM